ncbi:hypothetical protein QVD17_34459 [Tagetes erecta]|uniref:Glycosyltransferase n=1 Tax=Tagetes erecta TaxID=13708 RepID=A0AAD8NLW3_TARER|nr:hypothetical protein QVD17_34459 [Tagetes erecta]
MEEATQSKHIIMFPFMAQGHLTRFLELAYRIVHHDPSFTITIVNTPLNINSLRSAIANRPSQPSQIHLKSLPFNSSDHGLPPNSENTNTIHPSQIPLLIKACASFEASFRQFISDVISSERNPLVCIVSDGFMRWAGDVAKSFGIFSYLFISGAYGSAAAISVVRNLPHLNTVDGGTHDEFLVPSFPETCRFRLMELTPRIRAIDGNDDFSKLFKQGDSSLPEYNGVLCNTVKEIEPLGLEVLRNYFKLPVWSVGPLIPLNLLIKNTGSDTSTGITSQRSGKKLGIDPKYCMEWLDSHPTRSVLYVSFGSENAISVTQMIELAKGLEESKKPFIWVIRPPIGFDPKSDFQPDWLPSGFVDRVSKQGLVVTGWAPQLEILCHQSTGAFLSHCGWNSVLESLSQGVPMIGWPLGGEQGYNAKMLEEEMGVSVVLARWADTRITKEEVSRVINIVLDKTEGGKGDVMRKKATEVGELMRASVEINKGSYYDAMDDFLTRCFSI